MTEAQWASISRDAMQKVVEHLYVMGVLDGVQWAYLRHVCQGWNRRVASLLDVLPRELTDAAKYRMTRIAKRRDLEPFLLRNYPHRIHALNTISWNIPQTFNALIHILYEGCGINLFQLPLITRNMIGLLQFFKLYPGWLSTIRTAVENYTGDIFIFISWTKETPINTEELRKLETALTTEQGQSVFVWHTFLLADVLDYTPFHKRAFETTMVDDRGFVFVFRNRDPEVETGRCFDYKRREITKTLRETVSRKRTRPGLNQAEKRLLRMRVEKIVSVSDE